MRFYIETYGCEMNDYDSEFIVAELLERGFTSASTPESADVLVFNTCSVRAGAEERARARIMRHAGLKRRRPELRIAVVGCMAQRLGEFRGKTLRDFRAWLYVIAANHVNQLIRRKVRDERMLDGLAEQMLRHEHGSRERRWAALYRGLLTLGEEQQHLISLRFFEGLSHDEIARLVGRRTGSIRVKIHRALKELRPTLQRILDDECVWEDSYGR